MGFFNLDVTGKGKNNVEDIAALANLLSVSVRRAFFSNTHTSITHGKHFSHISIVTLPLCSGGESGKGESGNGGNGNR